VCFRVEHDSLYRYDAPVRLGPHLLRLNPRLDAARIDSHVLTVTPQPVQRSDFIDAFGNKITRVAFDGETSSLRVESRVVLETFLPDSRAGVGALPPLPWPRAVAADGFDAYRHETSPDASVRAFAERLAGGAGYAAGEFLSAMTRDLYSDMDRAIRWEGAARSAATTLSTRQGACRDISVLFIAACRVMGIPARFVSGYQSRSQTPDGARHLHAWAEVHLPGLGWRGFDATHGVVVDDGHVALCAAPEQAATMPVEGWFSGPARTSTLDTSVRIATQ
jgi:transglutaminase-like putative cysteine protease